MFGAGSPGNRTLSVAGLAGLAGQAAMPPAEVSIPGAILILGPTRSEDGAELKPALSNNEDGGPNGKRWGGLPKRGALGAVFPTGDANPEETIYLYTRKSQLTLRCTQNILKGVYNHSRLKRM